MSGAQSRPVGSSIGTPAPPVIRVTRYDQVWSTLVALVAVLLAAVWFLYLVWGSFHPHSDQTRSNRRTHSGRDERRHRGWLSHRLAQARGNRPRAGRRHARRVVAGSTARGRRSLKGRFPGECFKRRGRHGRLGIVRPTAARRGSRRLFQRGQIARNGDAAGPGRGSRFARRLAAAATVVRAVRRTGISRSICATTRLFRHRIGGAPRRSHDGIRLAVREPETGRAAGGVRRR